MEEKLFTLDLFKEYGSPICHLLCRFAICSWATGTLKSYISTFYRRRNSGPTLLNSRTLKFSLSACHFSLPLLHCVFVKISQFSIATQFLSGDNKWGLLMTQCLHKPAFPLSEYRIVPQRILWLQSLHIYFKYEQFSIENRIYLLISRKYMRNPFHTLTSILRRHRWSHLGENLLAFFSPQTVSTIFTLILRRRKQ